MKIQPQTFLLKSQTPVLQKERLGSVPPDVYVHDRPSHEEKLQAQVKKAKDVKGIGDLDALLKGEHTWTIG